MLTDNQKARARYHLGYLGVQPVATWQLGIPAMTTTQFMIEFAWDKILPEMEGLFELQLCRLDKIENHLFDNLDLNDVLKTGAIEVDPDRLKKFAILYSQPLGALSNMLGVMPNPFDQRPWVGRGMGGGVNCGVSG